MKVLCHGTTIALGVMVLCAATLVAGAPSIALAAGVVGTGTAASCTDAALNAALAGGGLVTFNCGPAPVTIDITTGTGSKTIAADTTIDGGGLIGITGIGRLVGSSVGVFSVNPGVDLIIRNLAIGGGGEGGAILNSGSLTVADSTFLTSAVFCGREGDCTGGAINSTGSVTVANSTFGFSGIRSTGLLTVANSTFHSFREGGALGIVSEGTSSVFNSTFEESSIFNFGPLTVTNSTFSPGSSAAISNFSNSLVLLRNTIVAVCQGAITDGGHNLDPGTSCGFSAANGSLSNTDPHFDPAGLQETAVRCKRWRYARQWTSPPGAPQPAPRLTRAIKPCATRSR